MRTTLILNDELAAAAKRLAADRRTSFSAVVNEALRNEIYQTRKQGSPVAIPVYGGQGNARFDTSPEEFDDLLHDPIRGEE